MAGLNLYIGSPGMGKTVAALGDAAALEKAVFVIDSAGVDLPASVSGARLYHSRREALAAYGAGFSVRYVPRSPEDFAALGAAFEAGRYAVPVVDELVHWTSANYCPESWERLCRLHRHYFTDIFLTTQQPQDVPTKVRNCATRVKIFRCSDPRALEAVAHWANPEAVAVLPPFQFYEWRLDGASRR